ncbi:MAG: hypothetical protein ACR2PZ_17660 [Pseudomonadales bacterium]
MNTLIMTRSLKVLVLAFALGGTMLTLTPQYAEGARGGGGRGGGAMRSGPAASGSVSRSRRGHNNNRRDNRRDNRREVHHDVRKERHEFREDRVRRHRARHLTYAAFRSLSCRSTVIIANGVSYYSCGGSYYERVYQGGTVVYVIVAPPPGY